MPTQSPYGNSINDFEIINEIGNGGFSKVFKARCRRPGLEGKYVAIKKISKKEKKFSEERIRTEIEIHSHLQPNPAFVEFYTSFQDKNYWYLVLELCDGGSLESYVKKEKKLSEEEAARLIKEVIHGVQILHHNRIVHRDLSLRNLLLTEKDYSQNSRPEVKIADFGFAVQTNDGKKIKTCLGTPNFMAPEVFNNEPYDFKSDCWSVGCVLYALLYGTLPFHHKKREEIRKAVLHSEPYFPRYASNEAKELLMGMLNKDQKQRIDFSDALRHPFFNKDKNSYRNQSSYQRSNDSGMSSFPSSGSYRDRSYKEKKIRKSKDASNSVARYNSVQNILTESQKHNYVSPLQTSCQNSPSFGSQMQSSPSFGRLMQSSPSFVNQMKTEFQTFPSRLESQIETPIKKYPECPKYPSEVDYLTKMSMSSHIHCSDQQSVFQDTHFERSNNSTTQSIINGKNRSKGNRSYLQTEKTVPEKCLIDIVTEPLNTARLSSRRKEFEKKDLVVSILSDGQVCLEFFKLRKGKKLVYQVYFISQDGLQIIVYKLKNRIPLDPDEPPVLTSDAEVQRYTFEDVPKIHWKKYQFAKYFVDMVRSITPKITVHGEHGTCIMMENSPNPNFEMNFYDGFQITESKQKIIIKDKNGLTVTENDENTRSMQTDFKKMKEQCFKIENIIKTGLDDSYFPITCKKKPEVCKRSICHDIGKENIKHSSTLDEQASTVEPRKVTIIVGDSSHENSHLKNGACANANEKNFFSSNESSYPSQLKVLKVKATEKWVTAEYEDGIQMCISMQNSDIFFRDSHSKSWLPSNECPDLQSRSRDSQDIIRQALLKEVKRKT